MRTLKHAYRQILLILLVITLMFPSSAWAQGSALAEVRDLLRNYYVEPVKEDVLNSPTIEAILTQLDDPYTTFMTAEQYQDFNNSLEQNFSGIGIYLDIVEEGIKVTALVSGSPAEKADLQVDDIITFIDGHSLNGLSSEEIIPLIRGPEGSMVQLLVQRSGTSFAVQVQRENIAIPSVTGEIKAFNTGYLSISSFASETSKLFADSLDNLRRQNPNAYIVDLRDNGGGYVGAALDIAGFFIGDNVAMQTKYRDTPPYLDRADKHSYIIDKPTIFLLNQNSASASEILAEALRDYDKAVLIGTQSYGKGCMQELIKLDSGDYFKMTVADLRSPRGNDINKKGIIPDLLIEKADPLKAAELLLSGSETKNNLTGLVRLTLASKSFVIDTKKAQEPEYWQAYGEIINRVGTGLMKGKANGWESVTAQELTDRRSLYYPDYQLGNQLPSVTVDKKFTLTFPRNVNWQTVNQSNIELIASDGERIPLNLNPLNSAQMQASPEKNLLPNTCYWLLLHPGIQYTDESFLQTGIVFTATVNP